MGLLTEEMQQLIGHHSAGMVATVNDDGTPAVSPKATFVVIDANTLAFGNIRSPGTLANIRKRAVVEVNFIDVLKRKAVRVSGTAEIVNKNSGQAAELLPAFEASWSAYLHVISAFVRISVTGAEMILSPAYDLGHTEAELLRVNLKKLKDLS